MSTIRTVVLKHDSDNASFPLGNSCRYRVPQVPGLDHPALCGIDILLLLNVLNADAQPIFGKDHILLGHLVSSRLFYLVHGDPDLISHKSGTCEEQEKDHKGQDLTMSRSLAGS